MIEQKSTFSKPLSLNLLESDTLQQLLALSLSFAQQLDETGLAESLSLAANATQAETAVLLLKTPQSNSLTLAAVHGLEPSRQTATFDDSNIVEELFNTDTITNTPNPAAVQKICALFTANDNIHVASVLGTVLAQENKAIGVLLLINKQLDSFNAHDEQLIAYLGQQIGAALATAKLSEQWDLIAEIMHEIKTPLMALTAGAELLGFDDGTPEETEQLISIIQQEAKRMANMTTDFTDLARLESGGSDFAKEPVNMAVLIDEVVQIQQAQAAEKGIDITTDLVLPLPTIFGDANRLKQVLLNFVSNGIKYNKENGRLHITAMPDDKQLLLTIADTGVGIPDEAQDRLFERFYRVPGRPKSSEGSGLGLAIAKRIIEEHNGHISVSSQVGAGTTFYIAFPAVS